MIVSAAEEIVNELPMAPAWFGILAIVAFAVLLVITYSFRGWAHRHAPSAFAPHQPAKQHGAAADSHGRPGTGGGH